VCVGGYFGPEEITTLNNVLERLKYTEHCSPVYSPQYLKRLTPLPFRPYILFGVGKNCTP